MCLQIAKTLIWNGGSLCKDKNFPLFQFHAARQLPAFKPLALPHPSQPLILQAHTVGDPIFYNKTTPAHRYSSWFDTVLTVSKAIPVDK